MNRNIAPTVKETRIFAFCAGAVPGDDAGVAGAAYGDSDSVMPYLFQTILCQYRSVDTIPHHTPEDRH